MDFEAMLAKLQSNSESNYEETIRILIKIIDNILQNPNNPKVRSLQKSNTTVQKRILSASGGRECLAWIGFKESETGFTIAQNTPVEHLQHVKNSLLVISHHKLHVPVETKTVEIESDDDFPDLDEIKRFVSPPFKPKFSNNAFLKRVELLFHEALAFDDKACQERAKQLIPLADLEVKAQENLRRIQEQIKHERLPDTEYTLQDTLLLELLAWFKSDFFQWVDSPPCDSCHNATTFLEVSSNPDDLQFTSRVEVYKCRVCNVVTKFPRYNDLNLLLETRRGRCGEWAQVFTLLCRAVGWDARYVVDELDHVWTEVYSIGQKRWLHCDPCENACDTPLMYEHGWSKQLTYVMAYSPEEVQDVTWRYSANHSALLRRRNQCTEAHLLDALLLLRKERQAQLTQHRRDYLSARLVRELCELMTEKQVTDAELQGRISGSMAWRKTRGESDDTKYVWRISDQNIINAKVTVKYSTAQDCYYFVRGDGSWKRIDDWSVGVFNANSVFRKEETDWKQVYLARNEGSSEGSISWKFELDPNSKKLFSRVSIKCEHKTYENGLVNTRLITDTSHFDITAESSEQCFELDGSKSLEIVASLSLGKGNMAWQHAQLFRQSTDSKEYPFVVSLHFQ